MESCPLSSMVFTTASAGALSIVNVRTLSLVLFVADLFHPFDGLAVELFNNGDVRHRPRRSSTVPMLLTRRTPDNIAWPNFLFRTALALYPAASGRDDQCLPERMSVPCCPSTGLEGHTDGEHARRSGRLGQWVDTYNPGEIVGR